MTATGFAGRREEPCPERGCSFDGYDGEGRLLGGAEPVVCRLTTRQTLDLLAVISDAESARYREDEPARRAAWRRIEQALGLPDAGAVCQGGTSLSEQQHPNPAEPHSAPTPASGTPWDEYIDLLRTGHA